MNKRLGWALVCQLLVIILGVAFYQSVRVELGPAQIRQGVEMGRHQVLDDLREAEFSIPEELDQRLPNKEVFVAPGLIELSQSVTLAVPAIVLQFIALGLTVGCMLRVASPDRENPEFAEPNKNAEQAGDGDA